LEIGPPALYVRETAVPIHTNWQEKTIWRLKLVPPKYPPVEGYNIPVSQLGLDVRCVYLEKLNKVELDVRDELNIPDTESLQPVIIWYDEHSYDGRFENTLTKAGKGQFVLERVWKPRIGYCGSAKQTYLIIVPEDQDESED
jgi:hypothetical protein